jgi:hypothetical protein
MQQSGEVFSGRRAKDGTQPSNMRCIVTGFKHFEEDLKSLRPTRVNVKGNQHVVEHRTDKPASLFVVAVSLCGKGWTETRSYQAASPIEMIQLGKAISDRVRAEKLDWYR